MARDTRSGSVLTPVAYAFDASSLPGGSDGYGGTEQIQRAIGTADRLLADIRDAATS
jgi:hypothetical protein